MSPSGRRRARKRYDANPIARIRADGARIGRARVGRRGAAGAALVAEAWRRIPRPHRGSRWRSLSGGERRWVHAQPPAPGADRPADVVVAIRAPGAGLTRVSQEPAAIAAAVSRRDRRTPRVRRIRY